VAPKYAAAIMMALQLVIAIYGGYFGAGMSILVLALLAISGMTDMHAMNGLKALLGILVNGVAVVAFVISGAVAWRPATVMIAGAMSGGYFGARLARRVDPKRVRTIVVAVAVGLTAYFFWRTYA